jgi:hypothetical protein
MKLILPGLFLLFSSTVLAQQAFVSANDEIHPVYVMLAPGGVDTGLEIRSQMLIDITHMQEGRFMGYRYKDQAFLIACDDDNKANVIAGKISALYKHAKVQKLGQLRSYVNEGFNDVEKKRMDTDNTFPFFYETEDTWLSNRAYQVQKRKWMTEHPDSEWTKANTPKQ